MLGHFQKLQRGYVKDPAPGACHVDPVVCAIVRVPKTSAMVKSVYVKMQKSNEINHHAVLFMRNAEPEIAVFPKSTAAKLLKKAHQRQRQAGATYGFPPLCTPQDFCPPCLPMLAGRRPDTSTGDCKATPPKNTTNELEPECLKPRLFLHLHTHRSGRTASDSRSRLFPATQLVAMHSLKSSCRSASPKKHKSQTTTEQRGQQRRRPSNRNHSNNNQTTETQQQQPRATTKHETRATTDNERRRRRTKQEDGNNTNNAPTQPRRGKQETPNKPQSSTTRDFS